MGKENRRKFIDAYLTVSRSPGLCFESSATRGSRSAAVASVVDCKQSHQDKRKRWRQHSYSPSFSAPSSRTFLSSLPRAEPSVNPAHNATPPPGDSALAGERSQPTSLQFLISIVKVCCQPARASSADRCSNFAEEGYSCVPKDSCRRLH